MDLLKNKTIIITGASSGIGKEIALTLLQLDTELLLVGRNINTLKQLSVEKNRRASVSFLKTDLSKDEDISFLLRHIKKAAIEPDILIHCAGTFHHAPITETSSEMMDEAYRVNFRAPFILTRDLLEILIKKKGQIIFINSTASKNPKSNLAAYASTKSALKTFAEVLHQEVYAYGVRVTNIYPGRVATPMQETVCKLEGKFYSPERYLSATTISKTVIDLLSLPINVEISELIIRPTT